VILVGSEAWTSDYHVPADYPTIQEALDVTDHGDRVLVSSGIYLENIIWPPRSEIQLIGTGPDSCVVDGNEIAPVIWFQFNPDYASYFESTQVRGFTLINGFSSHGGGIRIDMDKPTIREVIITDCNATTAGGGIWSGGGSPTIRDCKITNNSAWNGGGLATENDGFIVRDSEIYYNTASSRGGGIYLGSEAEIDIRTSLISHNIALGSSYGGGAHVGSYSTVNTNHVTFSENTALYGSAVYSSPNSTSEFKNCIFWENDSWGETEHQVQSNSGSITILYTDIQYGFEGILHNNNDLIQWLSGNINSDPLFCQPGMVNFSLAEDSPCISSGQFGSNMGYENIGCTTGIENVVVIPSTLKIASNYPDPFNSTTNIDYSLSNGSSLHITIYNINGQIVSEQYSEYLSPGMYRFVWNGMNHNGEKLKSGIYFSLFKTDWFSMTEKLVFIR